MGSAPGKVTVSFRFPATLRERLGVAAAAREESMTEVAVALLDEALASRELSAVDGRVPSRGSGGPSGRGAREVSGSVGDPMPVGAESGSGVSQVGGGRPVDFAGWLAGRTGLPAAICRFKISRGLVTIDGVPAMALEVRDVAALEGRVSFDGRTL